MSVERVIARPYIVVAGEPYKTHDNGWGKPCKTLSFE